MRVDQLTPCDASAFVKFADVGDGELAAARVRGSGHGVTTVEEEERQAVGIAAPSTRLPGQLRASAKPCA